MPTSEKNDVIVYSDKIAESLDADILLINAPIDRGMDDELINIVTARKKRKNVFLILVTPGGSPDAAYRIARCLQDSYDKYIAFISGYCKSAGTLCVLGANEIVMSDIGELGPLDVQLYKKDELGELSSGLVAAEALHVLQGKAFDMFEEYFLAIKVHSGGQITFKTATEIALKFSMGLLEPLYRQIDPVQVGDMARSMKIATAYGQRLMVRSKNFTSKTLQTLSETYPSHGFVIDRSEVESLFRHVRPPTSDEDALRVLLGERGQMPEQKTDIQFLSTEIKGDDNETTSGNPEKAISKKTK